MLACDSGMGSVEQFCSCFWLGWLLWLQSAEGSQMASGTCLDMRPAVGPGWGGDVSPAGQPSFACRSRVHRSSRWGQALCIFSFLIGQKRKNMAKPRVSDFWVSGRGFLRVCDSVGTIITTILDHHCWLVRFSGNICQFESALLLKKYCV